MKSLLISDLMLRLRYFDRRFIVVSDASNYGIGGVVLPKSHPLVFGSQKLNSAKLSYTTTEKELFAIVPAQGTWLATLWVWSSV